MAQSVGWPSELKEPPRQTSVMAYYANLIVVLAIYTIVGQALAVGALWAGTLSLMQGAMYGVGAYAAALTSVRLGLPFPATILASAACGLGVSRLTMWVAARGSRHDFMLITLAVQAAVVSVFTNAEMLTNGSRGITAIPLPGSIGSVPGRYVLLGFAVGLAGAGWFVARRVISSGLGSLLVAVGEDEVLVESFGHNSRRVRTIGFCIAGSAAAIGGGVYAHYTGFIDPSAFSMNESIFMLGTVLLAVKRTPIGVFGAVLFMVVVPEGLRFLGLPLSVAGNVRDLVFGCLLVTVTLIRTPGARLGAEETSAQAQGTSAHSPA